MIQIHKTILSAFHLQRLDPKSRWTKITVQQREVSAFPRHFGHVVCIGINQAIRHFCPHGMCLNICANNDLGYNGWEQHLVSREKMTHYKKWLNFADSCIKSYEWVHLIKWREILMVLPIYIVTQHDVASHQITDNWHIWLIKHGRFTADSSDFMLRCLCHLPWGNNEHCRSMS